MRSRWAGGTRARMTDESAGGRSVGVTEEQEAEITDGVQASLRRRCQEKTCAEREREILELLSRQRQDAYRSQQNHHFVGAQEYLKRFYPLAFINMPPAGSLDASQAYSFQNTGYVPSYPAVAPPNTGYMYPNPSHTPQNPAYTYGSPSSNNTPWVANMLLLWNSEDGRRPHLAMIPCFNTWSERTVESQDIRLCRRTRIHFNTILSSFDSYKLMHPSTSSPSFLFASGFMVRFLIEALGRLHLYYQLHFPPFSPAFYFCFAHLSTPVSPYHAFWDTLHS